MLYDERFIQLTLFSDLCLQFRFPVRARPGRKSHEARQLMI